MNKQLRCSSQPYLRQYRSTLLSSPTGRMIEHCEPHSRRGVSNPKDILTLYRRRDSDIFFCLTNDACRQIFRYNHVLSSLLVLLSRRSESHLIVNITSIRQFNNTLHYYRTFFSILQKICLILKRVSYSKVEANYSKSQISIK